MFVCVCVSRFFYFHNCPINTNASPRKHTMDARIAIIGGVVLSAMAGANVDYRQLRVTSLQPRNEAFGIWAVIYGLLVATAAASPSVPRWPSAGLVASLLATCVWAATVTHSPSSSALVALGCACAGAWYGLATWPRSDVSRPPPRLVRGVAQRGVCSVSRQSQRPLTLPSPLPPPVRCARAWCPHAHASAVRRVGGSDAKK